MPCFISACRTFAALTLAMTLSGTPVGARTLAEIKASGILTVGLTGDYPPYSLLGSDGQLSGADVTTARTIAEDLGVTLKIVPTTWKSMTGDLRAGRFDIAMGGVSVTAARALAGAFSVPVMSDGKRPTVRCADKDRYTSIMAIDQPGVRVAVNLGGTNEIFARAHFPHAELKEYTHNLDTFEALAAGQADVMVTDGAEVDLQAHRHPGVLCPADIAHPFDHFEKAYWMTPDPPLVAAVDTVVKRIVEAGDYQRALVQ